VRFKTAREYQTSMRAWCQKAENKGKLKDFEEEFFDVVYENYEDTSPTYKVALKLLQQKRKEQNEAEGNGHNEADYAESDYADSDEEEKYEESDDDDATVSEDDGTVSDAAKELKALKASMAVIVAENAALKKAPNAAVKKE
jgi:hypothetical protein